MDRQTSHPTIQRGRPVSGREAAHANEYFDPFLNATTLKNILGYYRSICEFLHLKPNVFPQFYPKLRANLTSWRAKALWKKFDARASHKCYGKGKISANTRVLIIGAGPCGLRSAIEAQLLGAKVVVIEKRDRLSRNNVLHLWPFVIEDLRALGAKKFFGKFCAGAIDHISIRQLQCILLKVALLLGVEIHTEVSFEQLIEPSEKCGWKAEFKPTNHPVSQYEFDVIIGADGKRNTLQGFKRKEFRGKLAIAITANFINKKTEAEARVEEISGVAFIFNQKFFKDLQEQTKIDLENIVYYKDDTHYFVMTAKKASLLEKGVIKRDLADTERLLALENVDREALHAYAREAANFSTNYQMPDLEFAVNHYGQPDVAMFDFTSMYAAENASKVIERNGYRLLMILVGDSLLEPFWPTGSGCARGFLSSLDAAWAIRSWTLGTASALDVLAERESIYRLLAQTTPDNLNKDWKSYTLDPITRYPNLNKNKVLPQQTFSLFETDNPASVEKMRKNVLETMSEVPKKRRRGNVDNEVLLNWITEQTRDYADIKVTDIASVFRDGRVLSAIINHYRPDLLDYSGIQANAIANNQHAFDVLEKELGVSPLMTADQIADTEDYLTMSTYVTNVYDVFRGEIPHVKHPKLELPEQAKRPELTPNSFKRTVGIDAPHPVLLSRPTSRHKRHADAMLQNRPNSVDRKTRKRRTLEKVGVGVEERQKMLSEIASNRNERQNRRRMQRRLQTEQFVKSMQMLQANAKTDNSQPFEDYSIFLYRQTAPNFEDRVKDLERKFTYVPDHDHKLPNQNRGNADEDFATRIKNMEDKWRDTQPADKKPKDLLRAIGKIETSDWNIKEIEKKILENKLGKTVNKDKEKVPKWSKEQFIARQTKMEKQHLDRQDSSEAKYADIDKNIKHLELKLKEGTSRDLGKKKVATITEKFATKVVAPEAKIEKSNSRPALVLPNQATTSEFCHFCAKRVYLMERLSAEGRFFHHGCFKCQYCHTQLRLGSYAFDRDGLYDNKFFCIHHYGMQGEIRPAKVHRRTSQRHAKSPDKRTNIQGVDLLDRRVAVQTPERIEFSNLSTASNVSSDHEESLSQMDEDEWTDKNFGASCAEELDESASDSSSLSDTDSDDEDAFDDALEEPATKEGTLKWAERFHKCYSRKRHDSRSDDYSSSDQSSYYEENTSDDDDSDTATEGEDEIRARELRKQEVRVEPPIVQTDTGTDTEVKLRNYSPTVPDLLNHNHFETIKLKLNKSCDNLSTNSGEFNSAESGDLDLNMNNKPKVNALAKSATASSLIETVKKPVRNFVLPPKEKRKSFGADFVPKFKSTEPLPLLIIKRTPSKISLPKEVGKPKVAINTNIVDKSKYFGAAPISKPKTKIAKLLPKQMSLPETESIIAQQESFNFEPADDDLKEIDDYIENLIANEAELQKPIDLDKYKTAPSSGSELDDDKGSSTIEDLLAALAKETDFKAEFRPKSDNSDKIDDLLSWMDDLDYRNPEQAFSDVKYKNLERSIKAQSPAKFVNKIPQNNLTFFERHLSGKPIVERPKIALKRSKTEVCCSKSRISVDLDPLSKVDIKKMLEKFEVEPNLADKRRSFVLPRKGEAASCSDSQKKVEETVRDLQNFAAGKTESDWCVNITVSSIPNYDFVSDDAGDKKVAHDFSKAVADSSESTTTSTSSSSDSEEVTNNFAKIVQDSSTEVNNSSGDERKLQEELDYNLRKLEEMYAKVDKAKTTPEVPKRLKKLPVPVAPLRKRCATVSPMPSRKLNESKQSGSVVDLAGAKKVTSFYTPKLATVELPPGGAAVESAKRHGKKKEKDCCIQ